MTRSGPGRPVKVEVSLIRPALLRDRDAAAYLARSPSWIRAMRAADVKAQREGLPPKGPAWVVIGGSAVLYRLADLDAWISENSVPRAQVAFSNRGGGK